MLILFKPLFKTSILILLFTVGSRDLFANGMAIINPVQSQTIGDSQFMIPEQSHLTLNDTIQPENSEQKEVLPEVEFLIPARLALKPIHFQVNSEISYLSFKHFRKNESKKMFFQAWLKEKELNRISIQTDSLRKVYAKAVSGGKDEIAVLILKNEERSMALNQEISTLYQASREKEDQYWQIAPEEEKLQFQVKIQSFRDSLMLNKLKEETANRTKIAIDTIVIPHESVPGKEVKTETKATAIVYKIQIGAFKGKIPESSNAMIKKLSVLRKVENYANEKGIKIYTTGNLKTYQEAVILQNQVKQEGVKNPTIIAFQKGKKISIDEARKINNEL
jgi:hypothetical protein